MTWRRALIGLLAVLVLAVVTGVAILQSQWFREQVRTRVIIELENATGGRVEIAAFDFNWSTLHADIRGLVVHGLEPTGAKPLASIDRLVVGIKIISIFEKKVDVALISAEHPQIAVIVDAAGKTNIPEPKVKSATNKSLIDFAVGEYKISNGTFDYASRKTPFEGSGKNLETQLTFDKTAKTYEGRVRIGEASARSILFALDAGVRISKDELLVKDSTITTKTSRLTASGLVRNFADPSGDFQMNGSLSVAELGPLLRLPVSPRGVVEVKGNAMFGSKDWSSKGTFRASGLAYSGYGIAVSGVSVEGPYTITPKSVASDALLARAMGGVFRGKASVEDWTRFAVKGNITDFGLDRLNEARHGSPLVWSSNVSGPVEVNGDFSKDWKLAANLSLDPTEGKIPLEGLIAVDYDGRTRKMEFGNSRIELPNSFVRFSGSIGQGIQVSASSKNLDDFLPALALVSQNAPAVMPVKLVNSAVGFEGVVMGDFSAPAITGQLTTGTFEAEGQLVQQLAARIYATKDNLSVGESRVEANGVVVTSKGTLSLDQWKPRDTSAIAASFQIAETSIDRLQTLAKTNLPLAGRLSIQNGALTGTLGDPGVRAVLAASNLRFDGEAVATLGAQISYAAGKLSVASLHAVSGSATMDADATYTLQGRDWKNGVVAISRLTGRGWMLNQLKAVRDRQPNINGLLQWDVTSGLRIVNGEAKVSEMNGSLRVSQAAINGRAVGSLSVNSSTAAGILNLDMNGNVRGATVTGSAEWSLATNSAGLGQIEVKALTLGGLHDIGVLGDPLQPLPVEGSLDARIGISPGASLAKWQAAAIITRMEVAPVSSDPGAPKRAFKNAGPIVASANENGVHITEARITGEGMNLSATGTVGFRSESSWDLKVVGDVALPVLAKIAYADLEADGTSNVDAIIRGSLSKPQVSGRFELKNAAFNLKGVPNGIENASGIIQFDRINESTRATLRGLRAQTGGGDITMGGFIVLSGPTPVFQLEASANQVRIRYPENISTTLDASLSLTGSQKGSLLNGSATVTKMGISSKTDLGALLANGGIKTSGSPVSSNEFLRNMRLDIKVDTSATAELQTSLTRDLQPEANLQLVGTAARPGLRGRVSASQGEINFLGNKYTINQGDIDFFNASRIEPILNLDVETKVRGITVNINFVGSLDKLNVNYRSDPPLQSSEIIALLTVGRDPGSYTAATTASQGQGLFQAGNSLIGQVVSTPISSGLKKLIGVSKLKIDPELTGVTSTPQARMTVEQQISRDFTITWVTALNTTQQTIVRAEFDFNKDFSLIAVRDENGVYGVDFQYRKRFR